MQFAEKHHERHMWRIPALYKLPLLLLLLVCSRSGPKSIPLLKLILNFVDFFFFLLCLQSSHVDRIDVSTACSVFKDINVSITKL